MFFFCRSVGSRFDLGKSTLSAIFMRVVTALNEISPEIIFWPNNEQRQQIILSFRTSVGIEGIVGAIDGTYIPIKAPSANAEVYINRKCFHAITLQVICDNKMSILDCFAGYPSRVSDVRIFRNSPIHEECMNHPNDYFDEKQFIIGHILFCRSAYLLILREEMLPKGKNILIPATPSLAK